MICTKETLGYIKKSIDRGTPFYYVAKSFTINFSGTEYVLKDKSDSREDIIFFSPEELITFLESIAPKRWFQRRDGSRLVDDSFLYNFNGWG